ncbi:MAG TPA: BON domain-containing protein [Caldimonas sp.]|nr:BON domain-containing protein [Caldimonas sp.]
MNFRRGRAWRAAALALVGAGALSACAPLVVGTVMIGSAMIVTDRRTSATQLEDEVIEVKAKNHLQEAIVDKGEISATSYNRTLLLTGVVPSADDKTKAEQAVANIENVQSVVNELNVGGFPRSFSQRSSDIYLASKIRASLIDAKDLFANSIALVVWNGNVYLLGRVTEREAERATEVTRGVSGVQKVVKVFQIISEAELANTAPKAPVKP